MLVVRNDILPIKGYRAMMIWPILFIRKNVKLTDVDLRHEEIHGRQQKEMLVIFFYLWYVVEWLVRLLMYWNAHKAYRKISFECEAYLNEYYTDYLKSRKHYAWIKYIV